MRITFLSLALFVLAMGCKDANSASTTDAAPMGQVKPVAEDTKELVVSEISVEDADKALQAGAVAVDANSEDTRKKNGIVPDAVILTSSYKYDLAQLPEDKDRDLIFYCSNTRCTASDAAAERASAHGYENIHIMREGIKGWTAAGKPTSPYPRS